MPQGQVIRLNLDRGFGFIGMRNGGDCFFHVTELHADLPFDEQLNGRRVDFDDIVDPRTGKLRAINVRAAN